MLFTMPIADPWVPIRAVTSSGSLFPSLRRRHKKPRHQAIIVKDPLHGGQMTQVYLRNPLARAPKVRLS